MTPFPTQSNLLAAMRSFLTAVLPGAIAVPGQQNRVPEPKAGSFVVMTPTHFRRLSTNVDGYSDAAFTGSIAGGVMTITAVDPRFPAGKIGVGSAISGAGLDPATTVAAVLNAPGGQLGTYAVAPPQTIGSETLSAGTSQKMQPTAVAISLEFHSDPSDGASPAAGDMAAAVSTLLRDAYGVRQFANQSPNYGVAPLHADEPAQRPFLNDQNQYEWRWVVEALLQANVVISVQQEFADSVALDVVSVDATFAP